jgi:hypothetical protein
MTRHDAVGRRQVAIAPAAHPLDYPPALRGVVAPELHARGVVPGAPAVPFGGRCDRTVRGYVEGSGLAVAVTAGFQRIVGHNDEAGGVYRVHNGNGAAFANEYSHFRFTPFIGATGSATAIALGYYREHFHACDNVLYGLSHFVPLVQQGCRATMQLAGDLSQ